MNEQDFGIKEIISHAKEYGFVYPSSEIYDGLQAVYDYGPFGVELKNNLKNLHRIIFSNISIKHYSLREIFMRIVASS